MTREFWHSIAIDYCYRLPNDARHTDCIVEMTKFFVNRNQDETISFHYQLPFTHIGSQAHRLKLPNLRSVLEVLVEESMRWESVSIETAPEDLLTLRRVKDRLPCLRSLTLGISVHSDPPDIFEHAPSLQQVVLMKHFDWKLKWSSLTTLKLFGAHFVQNEFNILSQAQNVETLAIEYAAPAAMGSDGPVPSTIRLPRLKRFSLYGSAQFLTILEAPMLDELELQFHIHRNLPSVASFLSRSSCIIQRLTIKSIDESEFAEILRRTPKIEHLELRRQSDLTRYLETLDASSRSEENLARRLKSLTVATSHIYHIPRSPLSPKELDRLMKVIKSRNGLEGNREGHVERLETLTVILPFDQARPHSLAELEIFCREMGVTFRCHLPDRLL